MKINQKLIEALKKPVTIFSPTAQASSLVFQRLLVSQYVSLLIRIRQGQHSVPDLPYDDMYSLSLCSSKIIFTRHCLILELFV